MRHHITHRPPYNRTPLYYTLCVVLVYVDACVKTALWERLKQVASSRHLPLSTVHSKLLATQEPRRVASCLLVEAMRRAQITQVTVLFFVTQSPPSHLPVVEEMLQMEDIDPVLWFSFRLEDISVVIL